MEKVLLVFFNTVVVEKVLLVKSSVLIYFFCPLKLKLIPLDRSLRGALGPCIRCEGPCWDSGEPGSEDMFEKREHIFFRTS